MDQRPEEWDEWQTRQSRQWPRAAADSRPSPDTLFALAEKVRTFSQEYTAIGEKNKNREQEDFYLVVVFRNADEVSAFLSKAGLNDNRYQSGEDFAAMLEKTSSSGNQS